MFLEDVDEPRDKSSTGLHAAMPAPSHQELLLTTTGFRTKRGCLLRSRSTAGSGLFKNSLVRFRVCAL